MKSKSDEIQANGKGRPPMFINHHESKNVGNLLQQENIGRIIQNDKKNIPSGFKKLKNKRRLSTEEGNREINGSQAQEKKYINE